MKRTLSLIIVALMLVTLCLTSCSSSGKIFLATGSETGTYYSFGNALGTVLYDKIGQEFSVQSTGASKANIQLVADGEVSMAIVQNDVMDYAFNGTNTFATDGAIKGFSAVCTLYPEVVQIIAKPGITSIADLKGKNVSVGDAGSGTEFNAKQVFEAYGMTFDDINKQSLGFTDSADKFKDGQLDAFFTVAGAPTTNIAELATANDFVILSIGAEQLQYLQEHYAYYTPYTLSANTYAKQTEDAVTVAVRATIIAADTLSEETVYNITKGIFENIDAIKAVHAKGGELSVESAITGISIPFHPGAEKYFKEVGAIK